jgi:hypothetical protein
MTLKDRSIQGGALIPVIIADADLGATPLSTSENWRVLTLSNIVNDNSNKTFTVPAGQEYQVLWIYVTLTTDGTVGNRQLSIQMINALGVVIGLWQTGVVQAASLTRNYLLAPAMPDLLAFRDTSNLITPLPPTLILSSGQTLRVWDNKAISAGGDDMLIYIQIASRSI